MSRLLKALIETSVFFTAFGACAQHQFQNIYLGADIGYSIYSKQASSNIDLIRSETGSNPTFDNNTGTPNYRLFSGYFFTKNFALELGYSKSKNENVKYSGQSFGLLNYRGNSITNYEGADLGILFRPNESTGFQNSFLIIGVTHYALNSTLALTTTVTDSVQERSNGLGEFYGIGYQKSISKNFAARGALLHFNKISGNTSISGNSTYIGLIRMF